MTRKQLKWLILIIPTITIGLWEYVRHQFLLPYVSMEMGNWLAPAIVLAVTLLLITRLFAIMERMQEELNRAKSAQTVLQERENMARELHDGIAQSLFLLSVKVDQLEQARTPHSYEGVRKIIYEINAYVRQAIANLRFPPDPATVPWLETLQQFVSEMRRDAGLDIALDWAIPPERLSSKEKLELFAIMREALQNVRKHAFAKHVTIEGKETTTGWTCVIADDGRGFDADLLGQSGKYGLKIMTERASGMGWSLTFRRTAEKTVVEIAKEAKG